MRTCLPIINTLASTAVLTGLLVWLPASHGQTPSGGPIIVADSPADPAPGDIPQPPGLESAAPVDVEHFVLPEPVREDSLQELIAEIEEDPSPFSVHAQTTLVSQAHGPFTSPYAGPNSVLPINELRTSETSTLFLAARLWQNGELYFNPEVAGGRGIGNVTGIAGFPNGENTRVGKPEPTPYVARLMLVQTFELGGEQESVADAPNQIVGSKDVSRLTFTIGKFSAEDYFDVNSYSHDPRLQFLNWSLMYNGAWDYPANVRGYTFGGMTELNQKFWAVRYGIFGEPAVANGANIDPNFGRAHGQIVELENRFWLGQRPGKLRSMFYWNRARMGNYRESLALAPINPDITATRTYSSKYGFGINFQQEIANNLGYFLRVGWNDGQTESFAFTEIDQTVSMGFLLSRPFRRPNDAFGLGYVVNGLSAAHRDYLAAGGLGFILGDGRLNYRPEQTVETFYRFTFRDKNLSLSPSFQFVNNPGYNHDRGPIFVSSLRVHGEF